MSIRVESIRARAIGATGLSDLGSRHFEEPLEFWVEDIEQPRLSDVARSLSERMIVRDLSRRLEVLDWRKRCPEIDEVEIPPTVIISGHERSGATFLHHRLTLHPAARALLSWELMHPTPTPTPPPDAASDRADPRIRDTQASIEKLRGTHLEQMHWVDGDDPEEFLNRAEMAACCEHFSVVPESKRQTGG